MKNFILILLLLSLNRYCFGQPKDTLKSKAKSFAILPSAFSYIWQGTHNIDFGVQSMIFLGPKTHSNIGLVIACNFAIINKSTYFTPTARLKLYKGIRGSKISWEASVGYSYTNIQSKLDSRITPEAGFSYRHIHLSYGYNIPLTNYTDNYTNSNRIALRYGGW